VTGDGSVLLDLKRDKYIGLGKKDTELLAAAIETWPKPQWQHAELGPDRYSAMARTQELCRSLASDGLLLSGVSQGVQTAQKRIDMKREWVSVGDELEVVSKVTVSHVTNFVAAFLWARYSLAWRPFSATVESVRAAKARCGGRLEVDSTRMLEMAALVDIFRQLRPLVFAAEGRCLLHALTLIRFLTHYDLYPEWVIGVATQPWSAHAWVQSGGFLLDTNPEKVCRYTPIMVV
jgi:hypothetical protein